MKLPEKQIRKAARELYDRLDPPIRKFVQSHPRMVLPYYFFWNRSFAREMKSVFEGGSHHRPEDGANGTSNAYAFRRNVHRLEKGLIMRPRRQVFATRYIDATVAYFETLAREDRRGAEDLEELYGWSRDVLTSYFEAVEKGNDRGVDNARLRFEAARAGAPKQQDDRRVPFEAEALETANIPIEDFETMAKNLKSVRWFDGRQVERSVIDRAVDAARLSPSACNRQTYEIRVYDDPQTIQKLASLPGGTGGFKENVPCLLVFVGRLRAFPKERDRHLIYIDTSLAAMSLVFALESQKVGTCIINWPDIAEKEVVLSRLMGLESDERVIMMMAAGYPDPKGRVCWSQRKPLDEIRSYNRIHPEHPRR